jgi:hypothetical protein
VVTNASANAPTTRTSLVAIVVASVEVAGTRYKTFARNLEAEEGSGAAEE